MRGVQSGTEATLKGWGARLLGVVRPFVFVCLGGASFAWAEPSGAPARADVSAPVRLLVLGDVPEFVARVRGQVSDLDVLIEIDTALARAPGAELEDALLELSARHEADVIAWLGDARGDASASAGGPRSGRADAVHVWVAAQRQVYSRRIGPPHTSSPPPQPAGANPPSALDTRPVVVVNGSERSATLETAALVVRSAVRSVFFEQHGAGGVAGDASTAMEASPDASSLGALPAAPIAGPEATVATADSAPPSGSLEDREGSAGASPPGPSVPIAWAPHAGLDWTYAGLSRSGSWSLAVGLALRLQRVSLGIGGSYGFPEIVEHADVELELRRQTLFAEVGWEALSWQGFALLPTLQAGVARFMRSSSTSALDRLAKPAESSISALASLELVAQYELTFALRLRGAGGVDFLSHVPRYLLDGAGAEQIPPLEAWRWQPNAGIALGAVF
jgi:hypothetical protein